MEGTNPTGKKNHSNGQSLISNGMENNKGNSPHTSDKKADVNKKQEVEQNVDPTEQLPEMRGKPPATMHSVDSEKNPLPPSGDERNTTEMNGDDMHSSATITDVAEDNDAGTSKGPATRSAASSLIEILTHNNEKLRVEAIESLLKIGDKSLSYAFASAMKDTSYRVRLGALRGLYKFGGDSATEYLITALDDKHPDVRRRSIIYLGWMRKYEVLPFITSALADSSSRVRKVAAYALGDVKDISAVPYLIKALDDTDQEVIKGALVALKRITGKSFSEEQHAPEEDQHEILRKWKEWWKKENKQ